MNTTDARGSSRSLRPSFPRSVSHVLLGVVGAVLVTGAAQVAVIWFWADTVPTPLQVLAELPTVVGQDEFWTAVGHTLRAWGVGLAVTIAVAVPAGILIGVAPSAYALTRAPIEFVRPIPPIALLPVTVLVLGNSFSMEVTLIVVGAVWPLLTQTVYGVREVDSVLRDTALSYRFGRWRYLRTVVAPSALPFVATGVRISSAIALILAVGAEYIVGVPGLGSAISNAYNTGNSEGTYALIVTVGVIGILTTTVLRAAERRLLHWHVSSREGAFS